MTDELIQSVERMSRDIAKAAMTMSDDEARYLVTMYYMTQEDRKRAAGQMRALGEERAPNSVLEWLTTQSETLEKQVKRALDKYTEAHAMGGWMRQVKGIGPVLSAGLLAHIDISRCPTAGHIWSYAGLTNAEWLGPAKAEALYMQVSKRHNDPIAIVTEMANSVHRRPENALNSIQAKAEGKLLKKDIVSYFAKRPWNADLKTLCWKIGQSFMKFSGDEECFYGQVYRKRKAFEIERNESGGNAEGAKKALEKMGPSTEAWSWLSGCYRPEDVAALRIADKYLTPQILASIKKPAGDGVPMLPPGQIDARARRYAVKIFLSHLHWEWYKKHFGKEPPMPFPIAILEHAHFIRPPH